MKWLSHSTSRYQTRVLAHSCVDSLVIPPPAAILLPQRPSAFRIPRHSPKDSSPRRHSNSPSEPAGYRSLAPLIGLFLEYNRIDMASSFHWQVPYECSRSLMCGSRSQASSRDSNPKASSSQPSSEPSLLLLSPFRLPLGTGVLPFTRELQLLQGQPKSPPSCSPAPLIGLFLVNRVVVLHQKNYLLQL